MTAPRHPPLVCPLDALPLERQASAESGTAVHTCGRHRYPEVGSIPVLFDSPATRAALHRIEAGDAQSARLELLAPDRWGRFETLARAADRVVGATRASRAQRRRRIERFRARHVGAFPDYRTALTALLLGPPAPQPEAFHYFLHRPADPTFLVAEAVTAAVRPAGAVLDLCCGSGHLTRRLALEPGRAVTGLDESFPLLWLARTFLAPHARFVCGRADRPLPFQAGAFGTVVCSDALHDTTEPALAAREILRVLDRGGSAFVVHLHNPDFHHPYPGRNSLSARGYAAIFAGADPRLLDEGPILARWLASSEVDLAASRPPADLAGARTFTLLAGDHGPDRLHGPGPGRVGNIVLNPMYRAAASGEELHLTRTWPSETYRREYPQAEAYLPEKASLGAAAIAALRERRLVHEAVDLFRRRVLLDLPPSYGLVPPW